MQGYNIQIFLTLWGHLIPIKIEKLPHFIKSSIENIPFLHGRFHSKAVWITCTIVVINNRLISPSRDGYLKRGGKKSQKTFQLAYVANRHCLIFQMWEKQSGTRLKGVFWPKTLDVFFTFQCEWGEDLDLLMAAFLLLLLLCFYMENENSPALGTTGVS